ncbi:MAG TPA: tRNA (adenosine(37)-N6)-dimethylallyltransferase MiaA [bacterium]|jgi:tRNA dimethylallyltransferase|nr:tRNA (adenosine(37)-N6)-dimethylallyltransferase MiaA [bacterium]HOG37869.1 tRNA (adenosine(37)-N6)-dimethylallyltransferase MiaA [bacterium]HQI03086.1 tRNA (adenosine(37)-N6)-dimethylallyltransferase MiaA [bacterium]
MNKKQKIICVVGPTACGKTKLGVKLASRFNGEIISADSRQVYKGMDIGTGKDLCDYGKIPYHLIDIENPKKQITLFDWQKQAIEKIKEINSREKVPFIVGGTGLYINSIVDGYILADQKINKDFRKKLNNTPLPELQKMLKKLDLKSYNKIDIKNKRRVIRAIEIAKSDSSISKKIKKKLFKSLVIGITFDRNIINKRIDERLKHRLENDNMIDEIKNLHKNGVSWKRLEDFGLEYRFISRYLQKKINYGELFTQLSIAIHQFAKRQMTWFNKRKDIIWIKDYKQAEKLVKQFLSS